MASPSSKAVECPRKLVAGAGEDKFDLQRSLVKNPFKVGAVDRHLSNSSCAPSLLNLELDVPGGIDLILATAKIDEFKGTVYSIGPFGVRVGFSFQQQRALNLVHALVTSQKIKPRHRVLIAGAGLAGITAKLALHGMGIGNVLLFEELDDVVKSQHDARHRTLHPCYNSWPLAGRFSPTSDLPFLNWYSGNAAEVAEFLRGRWRSLYSRQLSPIHQGSLKEIKLVSNDKQVVAHLEITIKKQDGPDEIKAEDLTFDRIIVATGFGLERDLSRSFAKSYWTPDEIDTFREKNRDKRKIFVSGIGDGGLMDFIRFGFRDLKNRSDLAIETISRLRHAKYGMPRESLADKLFERSPIEEMILNVENEARNLLPQTSASSAPFGTKAENDVAKLLQEGYESVLGVLPMEASEFIDAHVHPILSTGRLHLVGKLVAPFTYATAPINKLLVAHLLRRRPNLYVRARIDVERNELVPSEGERLPLAPHVVVIRHGGQPPVYEFSKPFEAQNQTLYRDLADLIDVPRPPANSYTKLRNLVSESSTAPHVMKYRTELADAFSSAQGFNLQLAARFKKATDEFWFEFDPEHASADAVISGRLGGFPHEVFGVPLVAMAPQNADPGLGKA